MLRFKCGECYEIPTLCHIETTYKCNQRCIFCYNPRRAEEVDYDKLDKIVESVAKENIPHVYLSGGEPSTLDIDHLNKYVDMLSKNSSVTILTNGLHTMKGLSKKVACIGIPIHGTNASEHEAMTQVKGSYDKMMSSIKYYIKEGYDVRCILVLTGYNYNKMYELIKTAEELGMESVYVNRYEDGGIGATNSKMKHLKPTLDEFREALTQILKAREECKGLDGKIGFGTAIPFCIDQRLIDEKIGATCGVGTNFCAINSDGDFRICNQSEIIYGNVLKESIKDIWKKREIKCFRDLSWVNEPCKSCKALRECVGGCKVDVNYSDAFCIDYAVRNDIDDTMKENIDYINKNYYKTLFSGEDTKLKEYDITMDTTLTASPYLKLNHATKDLLCVTRYQTVLIDEDVEEILKYIKDKGTIKISELRQFSILDKEILRICNLFLNIDAVSISLEEVYE